MPAQGLLQEQAARERGFSEEEIQEWKDRKKTEILNRGFTEKEADEYFGVKEFNKKPLEEKFKSDFKQDKESEPTPQKAGFGSEPVKDSELPPHVAGFVNEPDKESPHVADSYYEAFKSGLQSSVAGLKIRGKLPDTILPEDAGSFYRIAAQLGTSVGDIGSLVPPIAAVAGAAVVAPGLAAAATAGAISFGLTEGMRAYLIDKYTNGEVKSFQDFWERSSAVFLTTLKSAGVGAATLGTGQQVGKIIGAAAAPTVLKTGTVLASEIATMVTVGKALEGHVPEPSDFLEGAIVIGALHAGVGGVKAGARLTKEVSNRVADKLRKIYVKSGNLPSDVAEIVEKNPGVQEDLLSVNIEFPRALEVNPPPSQVEIPKELTTIANGFSDETTPLMRVDEFDKPPPPKPKPAKKGRLSEAELAIASRIVPNQEVMGTVTWKEALDKAYAETVDATHYLKRFVEALSEDPAETFKNPHHLARLYKGNSGRVLHFLKYGTFDIHSLEITGKSLKETLAPVEGELDRFVFYLVGKRVVELTGRNIETGFEIDQARQVIKEGSERFEPVAKEFYEFNNRVIDYLVDSGVLSKESGANVKKLNQAYIPLNRLMEEPKSKGFGKGLIARNPLKNIKGSERLVLDPLMTTLKNLSTNIAMAERNLIFQAMVELAEKNVIGEEYLKRQSDTPQLKLPSPETMKTLKEYGIEDAETAEAATIYSPNKGLGKDEIAGFIKGKRQVVKVSKDIARLFKGLDREQSNFLIKFMGEYGRALRFGTTMTPEFFVKSFGADQFDAFIKSENGYKPFLTGMEGAAAILKHSEDYKMWLRAGGGGAEVHNIGKNYLRSSMRELGYTGMYNNVRNVVKYPFELMRLGQQLGGLVQEKAGRLLKPISKLGELSEQGPRVGDFARGIKDDKSGPNLKKQALASRELTTDFSRMGLNAMIAAFNHITPFFNAQIQGLDRTARFILGNKEQAKQAFVHGGAAISLISLYLLINNRDKEQWNDGTITDRDKAEFWHFILPSGEIFKFKKPWEMGLIFGTYPEMALEKYWYHNPKAFNELSPVFLEAISIAKPPAFFSPMIEHNYNEKLHTGSPIVPSHLWGKKGEATLPELHYTDYTTETSKLFGQFVRNFTREDNTISSPAIIENYITGWAGRWGRYALELSDALLNKAGKIDTSHKPEKTIEEYPFIRAFMTKYPTARNQHIQDFYKKYDEAQQKINTTKTYFARGDFEKGEESLEKSQYFINLSNVKTALSQQDTFRHKMLQNPDIPTNEKAQLNDELLMGMIRTAEQGLEYYEQFEKQAKAFQNDFEADSNAVRMEIP